MPYKAECGIYCITNTVNNKQYIGSATNMRNRWAVHKHYLEQGCHQNSYLQDDYNAHGLGVFVFAILEHTIRNDLLAREQFYISLLNPVYNVYTATTVKRMVPRRSVSSETRAKMSAAHKEKKFTEEHRAKLSEANKTPEARKRFSKAMKHRVLTEESKRKMREGNVATWEKPESSDRRERVRQLGLANKGRKASPETRARMGEAHKRRSQDK